MELRPELIIQTVIKSLSDNVIHAIDKDDAPAKQQAQLSIALLEILRKRLPIMYRYDRHDLKHFVELAQQLIQDDDDNRRSEELQKICDDANAVLDRARAEPSELLESGKLIRSAIGNFIDDVRDEGDLDRTKRVDQLIVQSAEELTRRERSWMLPFGFEADASVIPELESLLEPANTW
jgi:hypothetical protein